MHVTATKCGIYKACFDLYWALYACSVTIVTYRASSSLIRLSPCCPDSISRAHIRKGRTLRRTVVKGAGQRKQVFMEQMETPRKVPKSCDLQQHLHQLFHRYCDEEEQDNDGDEEEEDE